MRSFVLLGYAASLPPTAFGGVFVSSEIGWKSLATSYGNARTAPLMTCVPVLPWPSV